MREREPIITFDDLPDVDTDSRGKLRVDASTHRPTKTKPSTKVQPQPQSANGLIYAVLAFIIASLAFISFQFYVHLLKLEDRVVVLEQRLSTTDASVSQSGVSLQLAISDLKDRTDNQEGETKKLWAANKKVDLAINSQAKQVNTLEQKAKNYADQLAAINKTNDNVDANIKVLTARSETLSAVDAKVKSNTQDLAVIKTKVATVESSSAAVKRKVDENAGWIESNNAFRQQTNKSLNSLEQQIKLLQPSSTK